MGRGALDTMPPMPGSILSLPSTSTTAAQAVALPQAEAAWATILVLSYLEKHFADQKDAWEVLEEKALEFVYGLLSDVGVNDEIVVGELIGSWRVEALAIV